LTFNPATYVITTVRLLLIFHSMSEKLSVVQIVNS